MILDNDIDWQLDPGGVKASATITIPSSACDQLESLATVLQQAGLDEQIRNSFPLGQTVRRSPRSASGRP